MSATRQSSEAQASQPLEASLEALNRRNETLCARVADRDAELADRDAENTRQREEISELRRSKRELERRQDEPSNEAEQLRRQVQEQGRKIQELHAQLKAAEKPQPLHRSFSDAANIPDVTVIPMHEVKQRELLNSILKAVYSLPTALRNALKNDFSLLSQHNSEIKTLIERYYGEDDYQGNENNDYEEYEEDGDYQGNDNDNDQGEEKDCNQGNLEQRDPSPQPKHRPIAVGEQTPHGERGDSVMGGTEEGTVNTHVDSEATRHVLHGSYGLTSGIQGSSAGQQGSAVSQAFMNVPSSLPIGHPPQKRLRTAESDSESSHGFNSNLRAPQVKFGPPRARYRPFRY